MSTLQLFADVLHFNGTTKARIRAERDGRLVHADLVTVDSSRSRLGFAKRLATKNGEVDDRGQPLNDAVNRIEGEVQRVLDAPRPTETAPPLARDPLADVPHDIRELAIEKLQDPGLIEEIRGDLRAMGVPGEGRVAWGVYLVGTSRLLDRPLAAIVRGATSSGKSYEITTAAKLFPEDGKLEAHHLSPKALFHMEDGALEHRFVVAGERPHRQDDKQSDATKPLREMISDGVLRAVVTETVNGQFKAVPFEKRGPIAYVESSSAATIFAEDLNRCLVFDADEAPPGSPPAPKCRTLAPLYYHVQGACWDCRKPHVERLDDRRDNPDDDPHRPIRRIVFPARPNPRPVRSSRRGKPSKPPNGPLIACGTGVGNRSALAAGTARSIGFFRFGVAADDPRKSTFSSWRRPPFRHNDFCHISLPAYRRIESGVGNQRSQIRVATPERLNQSESIKVF